MVNLNIWIILFLLAAADWGGYLGNGHGMTTVEGSVIPNLLDGSIGGGETSPCREDEVSGIHSRIFQLYSSHQSSSEVQLVLNGFSSEVLPIGTDLCPGNLSACEAGFTVALWLRPKDMTVGDDGVYYLSSGAQRAESDGFYLRLDSVEDQTAGFPFGIFSVAVATMDRIWYVRYQVTMDRTAHVIFSWRPDMGLDVYVDGSCAGAQTGEGYQRMTDSSPCSDDPFPYLYVGGRNDLDGGFAEADIRQITIWDAWKSPYNISDLEEEDVLLAYLEGCEESASHLLAAESSLGSPVSIPQDCMASCDPNVHQYALIMGDAPSCVCRQSYNSSGVNGSCNTCVGYAKATCGGPDSVSVYSLPSIRSAMPDPLAITGFTVSFDGIVMTDREYTVTEKSNVNISFSVASGENIFYSIYENDVPIAAETSKTWTYLTFALGTHTLMARATNEINTITNPLLITAEEDVQNSEELFLEIPDKLVATSEILRIPLEVLNGNPSTECTFASGDVSVTVNKNVPLDTATVQYTTAGVFTMKASCTKSQYPPFHAYAQITVQDRVVISLNSSFKIPQGNNLTIPFQITGTNITDRTVLYDGQTTPNVTCVETNCELFIGVNLTSIKGTHILEVKASNLISGLVTSRSAVYVGALLTNFSSAISHTAVAVSERINVTAFVEGGAPCNFYFKFGRRDRLMTCETAPCKLTYTNSFSTAGNFNVYVEVSNEFDVVRSENYLLKVYHSVPALNMVVTNSSSTDIPVVLRLHPSSNTSAWPTDAKVAFALDYFQDEFEEDFQLLLGESITTYYLSIPVVRRFDLAVHVFNAISSVTLKNVIIQVGEDITGLSGHVVQSTQAAGENVSLELQVVTGSNVTFVVDFGDGTCKTLQRDEVGGHNLTITRSLNLTTSQQSSSMTTTIWYSYEFPGIYDIRYRALNVFDETHGELSVNIINRLNGLQVYHTANESTGSPVDVVLYLEKGSPTPQMVQCFIDYDDGHSSDLLSANLSDSTNLTARHTYVSPKLNYEVKVFCQNMVSNVTFLSRLDVHTPISGCSVNTSSQAVPVNTSIDYIISVNGSHILLNLTFGDGSKDLTLITGEDHISQKVYTKAGSYRAALHASNPISECVAYGIPVTVQIPIPDDGYQLQINPSTVSITNPTLLRIDFDKDLSVPTNITASWDFGDGNSNLQVVPQETRDFNISHKYNKVGTFDVSVNLSNMVSAKLLRSTLIVLEPIRGINFGVSPIAAAVGANITLWIFPTSGSSITYNINYGDGCVEDGFQDQPHNEVFIFSYDAPGTYNLTIHAWNNLSSTAGNHTEIRVLYPVQGLHLQVSDGILHQGIIPFHLSLNPGVPSPSEMECIWDWGTGEPTETMNNVLIPAGVQIPNDHPFNGGHFLVDLTCSNALGRENLKSEIDVHENITNLTIFSHAMVVGVDSEVTFEVSMTSGSLVEYLVLFGDGQHENRTVVMSSKTKIQMFRHTFAAPGTYHPSVSARNMVGSSNATCVLEVMYSTQTLQLSSDSPKKLPNSLITFLITPTDGLNHPPSIRVEWHFGDGVILTLERFDFDVNHSIVTTHHYNTSGSYQAYAHVYNNLDNQQLDTTVVVKPAVDVTFKFVDDTGSLSDGLGPDLNWFPSGSEVQLAANDTLNATSFQWNFGNGEEEHSDLVNRTYDTPGVYTIMLQFSKGKNAPQEMHYVLYIVGPFRLSSIEAVGKTNQQIFRPGEQVDLSLLGSGLTGGNPLCITWDVGYDGQHTVYGPEACKTLLLQENSSYIPAGQQVGTNLSLVFSTPGFYSINVSVTTFLSTAHISREITVKGCLCPPVVTIRGPGNSYTPRTHIRSDVIQLEASVSLQCFGIASTNFTWKVFDALYDNELPIPPESNYQFDLSPGLLDVGLYLVSVYAQVEGFPSRVDRVLLKIEPSPLVLVIEGGSGRAVGNTNPLTLIAPTSSYDPDDPTSNVQSWTFNWSCKIESNVSTTDLLHLCDDNTSWVQLNNTDPAINLDPSRLRPGAQYVFRAEVVFGSRSASYEQTVLIVDAKINPTTSFILQGACSGCDAGKAVFDWSLFVREQGSEELQVISDLESITSTGSDKQGIAFYPHNLEGGREYILQLNVRDQTHGRGFTQHSFITNLPPYDGSCSITPTVGYAISTEFSITCSGWLDEGRTLDRASISPDLASVQFLRYRVMSRVAGETMFSLKTSGVRREIQGIILELGQKEFDYAHEVVIGVLDAYGAVASVNLTVMVRPPSLTQEDITSLFSSNTSQLSLLVSSGDVEGATQLASAILSVLPIDGNSSVIELRSELVSTLSRVSVWGKTVESLLQASYTLSNSVTGHLNDRALLDAARAMLEMAITLQGIDADDEVLIITTAAGITDALGKMIAQSDHLVQDAMGTSEGLLYTGAPSSDDDPVVFNIYGEDLSPEDAAEQAARYEEEKKSNIQNARMVAGTISTLAQKTINLVVDVIMNKRVMGQPPLRLVSDGLILEVYKGKPDSIANKTIQTGAGSFSLPDAYSLFGERDDIHVEQIVLFFNSNPYSSYESSAHIGSKGVLMLEFTDGDRAPLVVRNLTHKISIILQVDEGKMERQQTLKMSFKSITNTQYQKVELTEENVELRVIFHDVSDDTSRFLIYLRNGSFPDEKTHDAVQTIPRSLGKDETWDDDDTIMEAKYTAVFPKEVLAGVGDYYLGVVLKESMVLNDTLPSAGSEVVNVTLVTYASGCRYWDTNITAWSSEGCEGGPLTNTRSTHCLCNHLSSFAASFFVPPNSIDFSTVFTKDLADNAAVFSTVIGSFGLYLILLVWLRRKDRKDIIKWGVCPLADNHPKHCYFYQVTVQTGMGPGSGTRSKVSVILSADDADSGVRLLDDNKRKIFERGSVCHFLMGVARPLGNLSHIKVWHDNSGAGELASWYLSQVSVTDVQTREQFFFVCDRWLAVEKEDGAVQRVIPVATRSDLTQFGKLFYSSSRRDLFDDHIWFSLFSRPTRSNFTRVQRLSCCLCLLYLSMIASAMFYGKTGEEIENKTVIRLDPLVFTLQEVFVGFISALVVVPVNILIVQLFRKSKPSQTSILPHHLKDTSKGASSETSSPQTSTGDLKGDKVELVPVASTKLKNKKAKRRPFLLPHWCIYIGWLLIIVSSVTAAFFTVLYSLEWGYEKSNEWLTSMLMSLFNSVIIIQPFKVIALAIFLSLLFKKPTRMDIQVDEGLSKDQNRLGNDEEMLHETMRKGETRGRFCPPPTKAALEEARKKRLKELKMNRILKETGFYTIFVVVVLFLCFTTRDGLSFHMSQSIRDIFIKNNGAQNATKLNFKSLEKLTPDLFWKWVEQALLPGLYGQTYYNGAPMHWRHTRFLSNWQCYRVGPVRLRQLRVKPDACQIPPDVLTLNPKCHLSYSWSNEAERNFSVGWQPTNSTNTQLYSTEQESPWIFHDYQELNGVPHFGTLALYSGGGYVAEFGTSKSNALSMATFLRETGWYNELTRAIFVEFSVFNGNINLFSVVTMLAETLPTGGAIVSSNVNTLRLYHYEDNMAVFTVVFQVLFVAYLVYFFFRLIVKIKQAGLKELKNFWTAIELIMLLCCVIAIVMFVFRQIFIVAALQDVKHKDQGEFVSFIHIAKWDELLGYIMAFVSFLSFIRYMRLLRLNAKMSLLGMTLSYAAKDLFHFSIIWSLVFCAFAQLTYLLFHAIVGTFNTFITTSETLFSMLLGKFDFQTLKMAKPIIGGAVFVVYIMTMYMILTNMFITIVTEAFRQLRTKEGADDATDHEMVEFMINRFKAFFLRPLQGPSENPLLKVKAKMTSYEDTMDSLEVQVNRLVRFVESSYGDLDTPQDNNSNGGSGSPVRTLSRITLHSATSYNGTDGSPRQQCNRKIFLA